MSRIFVLIRLPATPPPRGPPLRSDTLPNHSRPLGPGDRRDAPPRPRPRNTESPQKRPDHRRRASESSMMEHDRRDRGDRDRGERGPRTESEERRRRERRKEREERHRREKERIRNGEKPRNGKPQRNLDLIDKLDVTGIYGQGRKCRIPLNTLVSWNLTLYTSISPRWSF